MYKKILLLVLSLALMLSTISVVPVSATVPRSNEIAIGTIGEPETVDPQWLYDTASAEIVSNVYDQLIAFMVDRSEENRTDWGKTANFSASLAYEWWLANVSGYPTYYFKIRGSHNAIHTLTSVTPVDPYSPVSSQWIDPLTGEEWHLWKWHDNGNGYLDYCDEVKMELKNYTGPDEMPFIAFHVQAIDPVDEYYVMVLKEKPIPFQCYMTLTGAVDPYAPVSSVVTLIDVEPGAIPAARDYHIDEWEDDIFGVEFGYEHGVLSAGDVIQMTRQDPAPEEYPYGWTRDYIVVSFDGELLVVKPCLTCWDIEYTFERWFVLDHGGGPQWMIYEPLVYPDYEWNFADPDFADKVDAAIETNCTHVWFTFAGEYPTLIFLQVIAQSWASILYMDWAMDQGCWNGAWGDVALYHDPLTSPLMSPSVMCGTGPYFFVEWITGRHWVIERFDEHWQQWPAPGCDGYVDIVREEFISEWPTRKLMFLAGDLDFCYVPRMYMHDVLNKPGIRCDFPLATLACDGVFYNFDIATTSRYLKPPFTETLAAGEIKHTGIPPDFFTDKYVRKAMCYCINYTEFIQLAFLGEAVYPATPAIFGLPYRQSEAWYAANQYELNLTRAEYYFKLAWGGDDPTPGDWNVPAGHEGQVWTEGFTLPLSYNTGNLPRRTMAEDELETHIEVLNPKFHVDVYSVEWGTQYIPELFHGELTMFIIGWLADYPDPHNFFFPFMHTYGAFSDWQSYSNATVDALIEEGGTSSNETRRQEIYYELQQIYIDDAPSVCSDQATGRHWERTWIYGWYYNPIYPGGYFKHYWKDEPVEGVTMQGVDLSVEDSISNVTLGLKTAHTSPPEINDGYPIVKIVAGTGGSDTLIPVDVDWKRVDTNQANQLFYAVAGISINRVNETHVEAIEEMIAVGPPGDSGQANILMNLTELGSAGYAGTWINVSAYMTPMSEEVYDTAPDNNTICGVDEFYVLGEGDVFWNDPGTGPLAIVDVSDLTLVVGAVPSTPTSGPGIWNWYCDTFNGDNLIDVSDLTIIVSLIPTVYTSIPPPPY